MSSPAITAKRPLYPNYLVYVGNDGNIVLPCTKARDILTLMRRSMMPLDKADAIAKEFSAESSRGKNMQSQVDLLEQAVESIADVKLGQDLDSLFRPGTTSLGSADIRGLQDFELLGFVVVRHG